MTDHAGRDRARMTGPGDNDVFVLLGQLLEATKAASESIKALSLENKQQQAVVVTTAKAVELLERTVTELNRIVRAGDTSHTDSLVHVTSEHASAIRRLHALLGELNRDVRELRGQLDGFGVTKAQMFGAAALMKWMGIVVFQILTFIVAIYAARK